MIRLADFKDTQVILGLLADFLKETSYRQAEAAAENREHLCKLIWICQQKGYVWLAFVDDQPVGLLMSVREANMWMPDQIELRELVWFVRSEYRNSTIGGRLFKTYCDQGEQLLKQGLINGYFTTRMTTTDLVNLERRGFRMTEATYIKEL